MFGKKKMKMTVNRFENRMRNEISLWNKGADRVEEFERFQFWKKCFRRRKILWKLVWCTTVNCLIYLKKWTTATCIPLILYHSVYEKQLAFYYIICFCSFVLLGFFLLVHIDTMLTSHMYVWVSWADHILAPAAYSTHIFQTTQQFLYKLSQDFCWMSLTCFHS